jgi:hypothetical protein
VEIFVYFTDELVFPVSEDDFDAARRLMIFILFAGFEGMKV